MENPTRLSEMVALGLRLIVEYNMQFDQQVGQVYSDRSIRSNSEKGGKDLHGPDQKYNVIYVL